MAAEKDLKIMKRIDQLHLKDASHGLFIWIQYRRIIMEKGLFEFAAISSTNPGRVG